MTKVSDKKTDYSKMSVEERIELVEKIFITYPELSDIMNKIEECHSRSKTSAEPKCLSITGESGCGKTTIAEVYKNEYESSRTEEGATTPVLLVPISTPATVKALATDILDSLGDPLAEKGTITVQTRRVYKLTKECGVELVIFDEFQHLIDRDSDRVLQVASDWIKNFLNKTKIPVVLMGLPYSVRILKTNPQLRRRFSVRKELKAFVWESPEGQKGFLRFLKAIEMALPFKEKSHIYSLPTAFRLYCASGGLISNVMKVLRTAAIMAIERGMESLTMEILALAYDDEIASLYPGHQNPFLVEEKDLEPLPPEEEIPVQIKTRRSHRKRREDIGSISEVLCA